MTRAVQFSLREAICERVVEVERIDIEFGSSAFPMHTKYVWVDDSGAAYFLPGSPKAGSIMPRQEPVAGACRSLPAHTFDA